MPDVDPRSRDSYQICPLTFNVCPGEDHCAPATFVARRRSNAEGKDPETDIPVVPLCPIAVATESLAHGASGLAVLLMGTPEPDQPEPEETQEQRGDRIRSELLKAAGYSPEDDVKGGD